MSQDKEQQDLIDAAQSMIKDRILEYEKNKNIDQAHRYTFAIEKLPKGQSVCTQLNLKVTMPNKTQKNLPINVKCDKTIMLLAKVNYYVLHAKSLIWMAERMEPVSETLDNYNAYVLGKEEKTARFCNSAAPRRTARTAGGGGGGGKATTARKKKRSPPAIARRKAVA